MSEAQITRVVGTDGKVYPKDYAANREAIRKALAADPAASITEIAQRCKTTRDTVYKVKRERAAIPGEEIPHEPTTTSTALVDVRYVAMCTAIAECAAVDEVKDIRDKAVALEVYAKQANNFEAERTAQEIRVRAEKQCGKLLKHTPKSEGGRPVKEENRSNGMTGFDDAPTAKTLADHGITKNQSSQWQQLADVPEEVFEQVIADKSEPITALRIINAAKPPQPADEAPSDAAVKKADPNAIHLWAVLRDLVKFLDGIDLAATMQVMPQYLVDDVRQNAPIVVERLRMIGEPNE